MRHHQTLLLTLACLLLFASCKPDNLVMERRLLKMSKASPALKKKEVAALLKEGQKQLVPLRRALTASRYEVRAQSLEIFAAMGDKAADSLPALIRALGDKDHGICEKASLVIAKLGKKSLPQLRKSLGSRNEQQKLYTLYTLVKMGKHAASLLPDVKALRKDPSGLVRTGVVDALVALGNQDPSLLVNFLRDPLPTVRKSAALALANTGSRGKAALPSLRKSLRDKSTEVRIAAARALLQLSFATESKRALPVLLSAHLRPSPNPHYAASIKAFRKLGVRCLPFLKDALKRATRKHKPALRRLLRRLKPKNPPRKPPARSTPR